MYLEVTIIWDCQNRYGRLTVSCTVLHTYCIWSVKHIRLWAKCTGLGTKVFEGCSRTMLLTCLTLALASWLHLVHRLCHSLFEFQEICRRLRQDEWIDEWVEWRREIQLGSVLYFVRHGPLSNGCVHLAVELESQPPPTPIPFRRAWWNCMLGLEE